ncbi:MAG: aminotransferase class IV, partial [Acidimicrobiia bacterium]
MASAVTPSVVWINGEILPVDEARISPLDHGLLVGDGVFETMRCTAGLVFAFDRHMHRLADGCSRMRIVAPTPAEIERAIDELLSACALINARIRVTVTSGDGPLGSDRGSECSTLTVMASPLPTWPSETAIAMSPWTRNPNSPTAGIKTTSYADNVLALDEAHRHGAAEAVFFNTRGELCEGTGSNIFLIIDDVLHTPPLLSGCLAGVTRALVLEQAAALEISHSEVPLFEGDLAACEEAFLT